MTDEMARKILTAEGAKSEQYRPLLIAALNSVGATHFKGVKDGDFEKVVETFRALKAGTKNE